MRNGQILTGDVLDERENILERFSLAGLHPQQGTTITERQKFSFYKSPLFFRLTNNTLAKHTQARCTQGTSSTNGLQILGVVRVTKVPIISFSYGSLLNMVGEVFILLP